MTSCTSLDREAVARDRLALDRDVGEVALRHPLGVDAPRASGTCLRIALDAAGRARWMTRRGPARAILMPTGVLMPVKSMSSRFADRLRPGVRESRELQRCVHLRLQLARTSSPGRHCSRGLQQRPSCCTMPIGELSVGRRCRGRRCRTRARLRGTLADQLVLHLEQPRALGDRQPGRRRRHVEAATPRRAAA